MLQPKATTVDHAPGHHTSARRRPAPAEPMPRSLPGLLLRIAVVAASCAILVSLSVILVDRPAASWIHAHLMDTIFPLFTASYDSHSLVIGPFSFMAGPAEAMVPVALVVVAVQAVLAASGRPPKQRGRILLTICLAVLVAAAFNARLKTVFGRTWPESWLGNNPSWIRDGVFGFNLFHGGKGWDAFPSGHTTAITTPAAILWTIWPKLRLLWASIVALVIIGLLGADYHFVSDVIAGLYLGTGVGLGTAALLLSPQDRLSWAMLRGQPQATQLTPRRHQSNDA